MNNIDSLVYLHEVAKSKSISSVAKNFHISQSALSQQLSKLETKLNVKLLNRSNKGVTLTPEGEIVFKHSETMINTYNKMIEELQNSSQQKHYISIESIESLSSSIIPIAISKIKKNFSNFTINLNSINCCSSLNLINNISDLHICYNKPNVQDDIISIEIAKDDLIFVGNIDFPKSSISKAELLTTPLIMASNKKCIEEVLLSTSCSELSNIDKLNIVYTTNSYISAIIGVKSTNALTLIPRSIYNSSRNATLLKEISVEDLNISLPIYLSYLNSFYKSNSSFIKDFKQILKGFFK